MPQFFKGDPEEMKYYQSGRPIADNLSVQKTEFYQGAYSVNDLGELIYDEDRSPLAKAIPREIFVGSFSTIFDSFISAGTFESYLTVFRSIFGEDVEVEFAVPSPGFLEIGITAAGTAEYNFITRYIQDDAYVIDTIIDDEGDFIVFQSIKGFESQYELQQMLFEMVPAGIYTEISLVVGE